MDKPPPDRTDLAGKVTSMIKQPAVKHPFEDLIEELALHDTAAQDLQARMQRNAEWVVKSMKRELNSEITRANERLALRDLHLECEKREFGNPNPYSDAFHALTLSGGRRYGQKTIATFNVTIAKDGQIELRGGDNEVFRTYPKPPDALVLIRDLAEVCRRVLIGR